MPQIQRRATGKNTCPAAVVDRCGASIFSGYSIIKLPEQGGEELQFYSRVLLSLINLAL